MKSRLTAGRFFAIAAGIALGLTMLSPLKVAADTPTTNIDPVQISPVCSTAAAMTATWTAYNKNAFDVTFNWTNKDTGVSGEYDAPANTTTSFQTDYEAGLNNQTEFTNEGSTSPVDRNASNTECMPVTPPVIIPPVAPCVDGTIASNLVTTWNNAGTFTVQTKNGALLCSNVTIYASSYVLPSNYDGTGFGDPTSYPQYIYDSESAVLQAGTTGTTTLTVALPNSCLDSQEDLYYAPEITVVGAGGHGSQFLNGGITPATATDCTSGKGGGPTPPTSPTSPTTPTAPATPTTPITTTSQPAGGKGAGPVTTTTTTTPAVTTLSDTGTDTRPASFIAVVLLASALLVATRRSKITQ